MPPRRVPSHADGRADAAAAQAKAEPPHGRAQVARTHDTPPRGPRPARGSEDDNLGFPTLHGLALVANGPAKQGLIRIDAPTANVTTVGAAHSELFGCARRAATRVHHAALTAMRDR